MFRRLTFRAHAHATEEEDRVQRAFTFVSTIEDPEVTRTAGYYGNPIVIFHGQVDRRAAIRGFWDRLRGDEVHSAILASLDRCMDGDGQLHLRFDKQAAYGGRFALARHDDVVTLKGKVEAHPARRDTALAVARAFLEGGA